MKTRRTVAKFLACGFVLIVLFFGASRFLSHHSLTVDILGSYFPAWMVCILSGLTLTLIAHWIVAASQSETLPRSGAADLFVPDDHLHLRDVDPVLPKLTCIKPTHL